MPYLVLAMLFCVTSLGAASLETIVDKLRNMASIHTIKANYKQTRHFKELDFTLSSSGSFAHQRNKALAWKTEKPMKSVCIVAPEKIQLWDEHSKATTIKADKFPWLAALFKVQESCATGKIDELKDLFDIRVLNEHSLLLTPKKKEISMFFTTITIQFNEEFTAVKTVSFTEKNNDTLSIEFMNTQYNVQLPESTWTLP